MKAFRKTAAFHHAAGEFVHDHDFVVLDHIVHIAGEEFVRAQRLIDVVNDADIVDIVQDRFGIEAGFRQQNFDMLRSRLRSG